MQHYQNYIDRVAQNLLKILLVTAGTNGLISFMLLGMLHLPHFLILYKEFLVLLFVSVVFFKNLITPITQKKRIYQLIWLLSYLIIVIAIILSILYNFKITILFQIKLDILPILFGLSLTAYFLGLPHTQQKALVESFVKITIFLALINAIIAVLESTLFKNIILSFILNKLGHYGDIYGIKIITVKGNYLRAFGLLNGFVHLGDFLLIALGLLLFSSQFTSNKKILFSFVMVLGLISSIYKSGIIGMILFIIFYILSTFSRNKHHILFLILFLTPIFTLLGYISSLTTYSYQLVLLLSDYIATHSFLARYRTLLKLSQQHGNLLTGFGLGKNGTYLPQQTHLALDSLFIYITSNYGLFIFLIIQIIAFYGLIYITYSLIKNKKNPYAILTFLSILYFIFLESWFNNLLGTYPISYLFFTILAIYISNEIRLNHKS